MFEKLDQFFQPLMGDLWRYVVPAAIGVIVAWIVWRVFRRRRRLAAIPRTPNLKIDVSSLGEVGPPESFPALEFYNLPMRLAVVVLAPVGRDRELPPDDVLPQYFDAIVPGLDKVAALHQPLIRRWPSQVSASGFAHLFFSNARLPGMGGKGTAWTSAAGVFKMRNQPVMAGLVFRAALPNSLGQTIIDDEHKWLGCLRVKWS
jgi:hypothetical protein